MTTRTWTLRNRGCLEHLPRLLGDFARWIAREYPPLPNPVPNVGPST